MEFLNLEASKKGRKQIDPFGCKNGFQIARSKNHVMSDSKVKLIEDSGRTLSTGERNCVSEIQTKFQISTVVFLTRCLL